MREFLVSFALGGVVGGFFALCHQKVPAPEEYVGIVAIFGITFGYKLIQFLLTKYF